MSHHAPSPRRSGAFAASAGSAAGALLAVCATSATTPASAEPARNVELSWSRASAECLGRDDLVRAVEATLGAPVFHGSAIAERRAGRIEGRVGAAAKGGFEAHMILRDPAGVVVSERHLDTDGECRRLDEPIAVVVALMIDALGPAPTPLSVSAEPVRAPTPNRAVVVPPTVSTPASTSSASSTSLSLGVGLGLASSLLPGSSLAAVLRGEVAPIEALPLAWTAHFHGSSSVEAEGFGGRFSAWTTTLGACPAWSWARGRLGFCATLGAGSLAGTGIGFPDGVSVKRPIVFAGLASHAAVHVAGPMWARIELGFDVPFRRDRWGYVDAAGTYIVVHRPAAIVPNGLLTLEFRSGQ